VPPEASLGPRFTVERLAGPLARPDGVAHVAVPVAGGPVQIEGASAVVHRRAQVAGGEVDLEQGGQRLAGDDPVVAVRRVGGDVRGEGERAVEVAEPPVAPGEAGERDEFGVRGLGVAGQSAGSNASDCGFHFRSCNLSGGTGPPLSKVGNGVPGSVSTSHTSRTSRGSFVTFVQREYCCA